MRLGRFARAICTMSRRAFSTVNSIPPLPRLSLPETSTSRFSVLRNSTSIRQIDAATFALCAKESAHLTEGHLAAMQYQIDRHFDANTSTVHWRLTPIGTGLRGLSARGRTSRRGPTVSTENPSVYSVYPGTVLFTIQSSMKVNLAVKMLRKVRDALPFDTTLIYTRPLRRSSRIKLSSLHAASFEGVELR
eukprot:TRINITY_DN10739_c0_g1_i1.p1 TRINITY_DN10739_c0_g1~~TRINITY_DN10739_c0_g1_i1.p1  ORF type:complete len:191 (+),score=16.28 TRINITY_DN10739_c0_g1_i1:85-657(+)